MEIIYDEIKSDRRLWHDALGPPEVGWGAMLSASAKEAWVRSPWSSTFRQFELQGAKGAFDDIFPGVEGLSDPAMAMGEPVLAFLQSLPRSSGRSLSEEEWKQSEYYRPGLSFPDGVKESVASLLADRKDEENIRREAISRGPKGIGPMGTMFATDLLVSVLDPLNE